MSWLYVKVLLYSYPWLKTVGREYAEHIKNRALLSYDGRYNAERIAEYLAEEILEKERLEWLKERLERAFEKLERTERELLEIRYFGKRKEIDAFLQRGVNGGKPWSKRKYFRQQERLLEKLHVLFDGVGVTKDVFEQRFAKQELFEKLQKYLADGKEKNEWKHSAVNG